MPGLTPEGLEVPTLRDLLDTIETDQKADISESLDVTESSPDGQRNGISARQYALLWELGQAFYEVLDPDRAEDDQLDNLGKLTGSYRRGDSASRVLLSCALDEDAELLTGDAFAWVTERPDELWTPLEDFIAPHSAGNFDIVFQAVTTGPLFANAGTLINHTSITGWTSCTNARDASRGQNADTNEIFRARREAELAKPGSATVRAIRADMLSLKDELGNLALQSCQVLENDTDETNLDGMPPHSLEIVVTDDPAIENAIIGQAVFEAKGGGIQTVGTYGSQGLDADGNSYPVRFSRPAALSIYLVYELDKGADYPGDAIFAATVAAAMTVLHPTGQDVFFWYAMRAAQMPGVVNVLSVKLGLGADPTESADLPVSVRQRAAFDTSRITVL